ncbi:hypothetical protein ACKWTF_001047 [Chironomus riparius]
MNIQHLTLLCLIFAFVKCQSSDDDPVGTECSTRGTHFPGTCQHRDDCPAIKSGFIPSRNVTYCNRRQGLVCCPNRELEPPNEIRIQGDRISEKKCREYAKVTQKEIVIGSLILGRPGRVVIQDKCQHKSVSLIVGGVNALPSEFPHQAHLGYKPRENKETDWVCGGSLISANYVLTATHCLNQKSTGPVKFVKLGMLTRSQRDENVYIFDVEKTHPYPEYNPRTFENDIGLIKFRGKVTFNEHLYPICLPTTQLDNQDVIVTGFGKTGANHEQTEYLMKVILNRFTHNECQTLYPNSKIVKETMLCYGSRKEKKDACRVRIC